jgi:integrase
LASIRSKDIADVIKVMVEDEGKAPNTIRLHLAIISHLFSVAATDWGMESLSNPVEHVRKPKLPKGRDRRLIGDEEARLLDACRAVNPELASIVRIAIETAMRQGEILSLTWAIVDLHGRVIHLPDSKNGEARDVPLSTAAEAVLRALPRRMDGRVWGYTQEGMRASYVKAKKHAGIKGLTFHDLRHEAASRMFEIERDGVKVMNPMQVAAITGHKTLQMLKRYTHLRAEDLAKLLG